MEKYFKRSSCSSQRSPLNQETQVHGEVGSLNLSTEIPNHVSITHVEQNIQHALSLEVDVSSLPADPADRKPMMLYHPNVRDQVRRHYIQKGPYQPRNPNFPTSYFTDKSRPFNNLWFDKYPSWLKYSIKKDAVFCLPCYLFHNEKLGHRGGETFSATGFRAWNKSERYSAHVGGPSSTHNQCSKMCVDLLNKKQSIQTALIKQTKQIQTEYRTRLIASIDVARLLLTCGFLFRGHDESESSGRKGNFFTVLDWYANRVESVGDVTLKNAPKNLQLTSPKIQKDIVRACANETVKAIIEDIGDDYFTILVDESRDVSHKEQMALVVRYVDKRGFVMERLIGVVHVGQTSAVALKKAVYSLLAQHSLSPHNIRGQCYDGASNMQGHLNGLRTLIMSDSRSAHSIHCFAHQLQLTLVAVAKNHEDAAWLFDVVNVVLNVVGTSFKNRDVFRAEQAIIREEAIRLGELETGRGLNQELGLNRPGDTHWSSHFKSLQNLIITFPSLIEVIDDIAMKSSDGNDRQKAQGLLNLLQSFRFVFMLHLMEKALAITDQLNMALQKREQDIVNAMFLLATAKTQLQAMRDNGWEDLILEVTSFCMKQNILTLDMDAMHYRGGSNLRRRVDDVTNEHYYRVSILYAIVDMQIQELNYRFSEVNTELLLGLACLNPADSFAHFDKTKLLAMARLYPNDFDCESKVHELSRQLDNFIANMHHDPRFSDLNEISALARKLVETK